MRYGEKFLVQRLGRKRLWGYQSGTAARQDGEKLVKISENIIKKIKLWLFLNF